MNFAFKQHYLDNMCFLGCISKKALWLLHLILKQGWWYKTRFLKNFYEVFQIYVLVHYTSKYINLPRKSIFQIWSLDDFTFEQYFNNVCMYFEKTLQILHLILKQSWWYKMRFLKNFYEVSQIYALVHYTSKYINHPYQNIFQIWGRSTCLYCKICVSFLSLFACMRIM